MNLARRDRKVIWHPFTPQVNAYLPLEIVKGKGAYLIDAKGKKYLDAFSSWWVNLHGHANSYIARKIFEQAKTLEQAAFSSVTHEPAVALAERLLAHLPGQQRVFYSDNGSTAVEVALKMAMQFYFNRGQKVKRIIAMQNSYHGDTFGSMSVAERNIFNSAFAPYLFHVAHIPVPVKGKEQLTLRSLKRALLGGGPAIFIFEPLVQGAGGMVMYEPVILSRLMKECKQHNCITIADEVMTGFGRTGRFFACDHLTEKPDIFCLSKGITGGFMPLGVTTCNRKIFDAFASSDKRKTFYHGHSYTANPVACAAANASLTLLESRKTWKQIEMISLFFKGMKKMFERHPALLQCRCRGTILAMEFKTKERTSYLNPLSERLTAFFLERGIMVRPLGNILYFLPPYCISKAALQHICNVTGDAIKRFGIKG